MWDIPHAEMCQIESLSETVIGMLSKERGFTLH